MCFSFQSFVELPLISGIYITSHALDIPLISDSFFEFGNNISSERQMLQNQLPLQPSLDYCFTESPNTWGKQLLCVGQLCSDGVGNCNLHGGKNRLFLRRFTYSRSIHFHFNGINRENRPIKHLWGYKQGQDTMYNLTVDLTFNLRET